MATVTLSPKFQIVIPKEVREKMDMSPGMKLEIISYGDIIELVPIQPIEELEGFLKGINTNIIREKDRDL